MVFLKVSRITDYSVLGSCTICQATHVPMTLVEVGLGKPVRTLICDACAESRADEPSEKLPPAAELAKLPQSDADKAQQCKYEAHRRAMDRATMLIKKAHQRGERRVSYQTFPESVVEELRRKGYKVTLRKAAGMGDVDSHEIEW